MSAIFRKTDKEYYVVSPVGYISPFSFALKNAKELKLAKRIYNVCFILTSMLLLWHYRTYNNVDDPIKWMYLLAIFIGAHTVIYAVLAFAIKNIKIFDSQKHGEILAKQSTLN